MRKEGHIVDLCTYILRVDQTLNFGVLSADESLVSDLTDAYS